MGNAVIAVLILVVAAALGATASIFGGGITLLVLAASLPLPVILRDYRAGVILLAMLLPISPMLPPIRGLNVLNFITVATLGSFALKKLFSRAEVVALPRLFVLCFIAPATMAIMVAFPHIPEAARNYYMLPDAAQVYQPTAYVISRFVKPVFYYFSFAFLLANAIKDSQKPERFFLLMAVASIPPCLAVFYTVATYPGSLIDLSRDREFMAPRGMHANEFGMLLALASGPLLFLIGKMKGRVSNAAMAVSFAIVTVGLLLTFSRGGLLAYLIAVACYLVINKRVKIVVVVMGMLAILLLLSPEAIQDRFSTGLRPGAIGDASDIERDDLTAGRVHGWTLLAPEVLESPLIGRGLGSTQWSSAVMLGRYKADHPHNIYLEILMDMGVLGLVAFIFLFFSILRRLKQLSVDASVPQEFRAFYLGSRFALFGILAMAATTAYYMPNAAQTFFWFGCGVLFLRWKPELMSAQDASRKRAGGQRPPMRPPAMDQRPSRKLPRFP